MLQQLEAERFCSSTKDGIIGFVVSSFTPGLEWISFHLVLSEYIFWTRNELFHYVSHSFKCNG